MSTHQLPEHPDFLWRNPEPKSSLRRRHRRRRRARPGHRLLPGQEPRHDQHRRPGEGLAGRRQHGPQHHDHPLQLPLGRERGDLRARPEAVGDAARGARLRLPVQPARRHEPRPHPGGRPRERAPRRGEPAQRRRRRVAGPGAGQGTLPDPQHQRQHPLPGHGRHLPAARRHRQARPRGLGVRPQVRRDGRGHHPELRGHRLRQGRQPGGRRRDQPRHGSTPTRSACAPPGTARSWRSWPASGCRSSPTRCRRWSPNCTSRSTRRS